MNDMVKSLSPFMASESSQKWLQRLPTLAVIVLLLLIAWASAQLFWQALTPSAPGNVVAQRAGPAGSSSTAPDYASQIANKSLFGKANVEASASTEEPEDAPDTRLNLKLVGVYAVDDPKQGYAIIANGSRPEELVLVDGKMAGNIVLDSVYPDRVLISRAGKRETLRLPATESTGIKFTSKGGARNSKKAAQSLGDFRKELTQNPAKLAEFVNAAPARENGKFVGYRITTLKPHPMLSQVDIQSGDIITRINGVDISSPAQGVKALQKLSTDNSVQLTLSRGGQVIEVNQTF